MEQGRPAFLMPSGHTPLQPQFLKRVGWACGPSKGYYKKSDGNSALRCRHTEVCKVSTAVTKFLPQLRARTCFFWLVVLELSFCTWSVSSGILRSVVGPNTRTCSGVKLFTSCIQDQKKGPRVPAPPSLSGPQGYLPSTRLHLLRFRCPQQCPQQQRKPSMYATLWRSLKSKP